MLLRQQAKPDIAPPTAAISGFFMRAKNDLIRVATAMRGQNLKRIICLGRSSSSGFFAFFSPQK
ncbi:hypothetical protein KQQSB11_480064 [Klebsiella quasipneumoniae subsp. quasipneumoniae]|nr:hypothetical protein KQQSB11_480064 [Klebsiella quasipneumoniae subsp. quasipneumoniae]